MSLGTRRPRIPSLGPLLAFGGLLAATSGFPYWFRGTVPRSVFTVPHSVPGEPVFPSWLPTGSPVFLTSAAGGFPCCFRGPVPRSGHGATLVPRSLCISPCILDAVNSFPVSHPPLFPPTATACSCHVHTTLGLGTCRVLLRSFFPIAPRIR